MPAHARGIGGTAGEKLKRADGLIDVSGTLVGGSEAAAGSLTPLMGEVRE